MTQHLGVLTKLQTCRPGACWARAFDVDHTCSAVLTTHFSAPVERCRLEPRSERRGCRQYSGTKLGHPPGTGPDRRSAWLLLVNKSAKATSRLNVDVHQ